MVAAGRLRRCLIVNCSRSRSLIEGLAVALSPVVAAGRLRRCLIVNCSRSRSLRGSGGCVVAGGRPWSPDAGGRRWSAAALSYCDCSRSRSLRGSGCCVVAAGRLRRCLIVIAVDLALLEGLAAALSPVVAAGRLRRCLIVNCSRSRSLRGSGGCVVAGGRPWSPEDAGGRRWSPLVGCGAVLLCIAVDLALLIEGLAAALSPVVAAGRLRRCLIVNCSRSCCLRGSGGCVVAGGRPWSPEDAGGRRWSPLVGCGAVLL